MADLLPHHRRELEASGLSEATIRAAGIQSETDAVRIMTLLGWRKPPKKLVPALVYPYRGPDGAVTYHRIKPDNPRTTHKQPVKYESPAGRPNELYLPPGVQQSLADPEQELLLTEGEKKSLAATQLGFPCLGLVGVYGWKRDKRHEALLPALEQIAWAGRRVYIVFDSDLVRNEHVQDAERRLAKHQADRGARVRCARLPDGPNDPDGRPAKQGLDDFLVAAGERAARDLRKLLDEAVEPEPLAAADFKRPASELDAADEARGYLERNAQDGHPRIVFAFGSWWWWRRGAYHEVQEVDIRNGLNRDYLSERFTRLTRNHTGNVLEQLRAQAAADVWLKPPAWLGPSPPAWQPNDVLAMRNGLLHLPTFAAGGAEAWLPATPRFFTTAATEFDFVTEPPPIPAWTEFLQQLWPDDPDSLATLQEWFGYCLTPDTRQQKLLLLIGPPRSGKGTLAAVLTGLVGQAHVATPTPSQLGERFGLAPLIGKPVAIFSDARLSGRSDAAAINERLLSIVGEDVQTIDRKNLSHYSGKLPTRFLFVSNELPELRDASGALISRAIVLRLTTSFAGREDLGLKERLASELPGILHWAIAGWKRLHDRGRFTQPESGRELLDELTNLTSPIREFLGETCLVGPPYQVDCEDLYGAWSDWCQRHGRECGSGAIFGRDLRAAAPQARRNRVGPRGARRYTYDGIGLKVGESVS